MPVRLNRLQDTGRSRRLWIVAHLCLSLLLGASCSHDSCPLDSEACPGPAHLTVWSFAISPTETEPVDTTYLSLRCGLFVHPPGHFQWSISVGELGPIMRYAIECASLSDSITCRGWIVDQAVIWYPPPAGALCRGSLRILIPCWGEFQGSIYTATGHVVSPLLVISEPMGAAILLDNASTGLTTPDTLCVRDWWHDHIVTLELVGYESQSWSTHDLLSPFGIDSVMARLKPSHDSDG
jgi:hypothetical protein